MVLLTFLPLTCPAQLPEDSAELVRKLSSWELEQQAILQSNMKAKRAEVVEILKRQMTETTSSGDLDGALAIKQEIERLTSPRNPYPGSKTFNGHYYRALDTFSSWHDAVKACEALGGKLATPANSAENEFLANLARESKFDCLWLGASDEDREGKWEWEGTALPFTHWDNGQPNNAGKVEHFAVILNFDTGQWWDFPDLPLDFPQFTGKRIPGAICQWE